MATRDLEGRGRKDEAEEHARRLFVRYLRANGMKVTGERLAILGCLVASDEFLDADEVLTRARATGADVSRATVYRTLDLLASCGLATRGHFGAGRTRFKRSRPGRRSDHLVCAGCGRVVELTEPEIAEVEEQVCTRHGFTSLGHALQIDGLCPECARSAE